MNVKGLLLTVTDFVVPLGSISTQLAQSKQSSAVAEDIMYYLLGWLTDNSTEECNAWEKMLLYLEQVMRQDARWRARLGSTTFDVMTGDYIVIAVRRAASQQAGVLWNQGPGTRRAAGTCPHSGGRRFFQMSQGSVPVN